MRLSNGILFTIKKGNWCERTDWSLHEPLKEKEGFPPKPRTNISETRGRKKEELFLALKVKR